MAYLSLKAGDTVFFHTNKYTKKYKSNASATISALKVVPLQVIKYDLKEESVTLLCPEMIGLTLKVHISFYPLGIGLYGADSFMRPDLLPPKHPGFITSLEDNFVCTHNFTGTRCRMSLDQKFEMNGRYTLDPIDGDSPAKSYTSQRWNHRDLQEYLSGLMYSKIMGKGKIRGFIFKDSYVNQVLLSNKTAEDTRVILVFPDGSLTSFPIMYLDHEVVRASSVWQWVYTHLHSGHKSFPDRLGVWIAG